MTSTASAAKIFGSTSGRKAMQIFIGSLKVGDEKSYIVILK